MTKIVTINKTVEDKIITIRGQKVLLDSSVALLYGVETREINQAVSTTIAIIETFAKVREATRAVAKMKKIIKKQRSSTRKSVL